MSKSYIVFWHLSWFNQHRKNERRQLLILFKGSTNIPWMFSYYLYSHVLLNMPLRYKHYVFHIDQTTKLNVNIATIVYSIFYFCYSVIMRIIVMKVKCKVETINYKTLMFFIAIFFLKNSSKTIKVCLYCIKIYKNFMFIVTFSGTKALSMYLV